MLTEYKKNLFKVFGIFALIVSSAVCCADTFHQATQLADHIRSKLGLENQDQDLVSQVSNVVESIENVATNLQEKVPFLLSAINDKSVDAHLQIIEKNLDKKLEESQQTLHKAFGIESVTSIKNRFMNVQPDDAFEFKVDKIGLGSAVVGIATVSVFNRVIKSGVMPQGAWFRRLLSCGLGYGIYKLVSTNPVIKKDICDLLSRAKKD